MNHHEQNLKFCSCTHGTKFISVGESYKIDSQTAHNCSPPAAQQSLYYGSFAIPEDPVLPEQHRGENNNSRDGYSKAATMVHQGQVWSRWNPLPQSRKHQHPEEQSLVQS